MENQSEKNLFVILGLPAVGKTSITKHLNTIVNKSSLLNIFSKENRKKINIIEEDLLFLQCLNKTYKEIPKFKSYKEFNSWKSSNKELSKKLSQPINGKTFYETTYDNIYKETLELSKNNKDEIYILDTGGYSYNRELKECVKIYIEYKSLKDFYTRFKERYNVNGNLIRYIPFKNTFIEINEFNYMYHYEFLNRLFKEMSNEIIINEDIKECALKIKELILK